MKMIDQYKYVIIGASRAGLTAAETLRANDNNGSILVISEEAVLPYKRTDLSKHINDELKDSSFLLYPKSWYSKNRIDLFKNSKVLSINPEKYFICLKKGQKIGYEKVLIATGARPRRLEIPGGEYIYYLRNRKDLELIQNEMHKVSSILVIGGGVEGVELADQFHQAKKRVTLLTSSERLMENWLDDRMSAYLADIMKKKGIMLFLDRLVSSLEPEGKGFNVHCKNSHHYSEMVVASTGILPQPGPAEELGLCGERGILVNSYMETTQKNIYAAGDVLELPENFCHGLWHAAEYQGRIAALNMCGREEKLDTRSYRLKTQVFDSFIYSQNYKQARLLKTQPVIIDNQNQYLRLLINENETTGALMFNLQEKAKLLQASIHEKRPFQEILKNLKIVKDDDGEWRIL